MRYLLFLMLIAATACNGPKEPTDEEITTAVKGMYLHMQTAAGAGGWAISSVTVLGKERGADNRHYKAEVEVSGIRKSPPIANPPPDEPFMEKRQLALLWRGGRWVEETTYDQ